MFFLSSGYYRRGNVGNSGIFIKSGSGIGHENVRRGGVFFVKRDCSREKSRNIRVLNKFCE